jgi:uncharacterized membrane protein
MFLFTFGTVFSLTQHNYEQCVLYLYIALVALWLEQRRKDLMILTLGVRIPPRDVGVDP